MDTVQCIYRLKPFFQSTLHFLMLAFKSMETTKNVVDVAAAAAAVVVAILYFH